MYVICTTAGDELRGGHLSSLNAAVAEATWRLEDDPELGELTVWELDENEAFSYHVKTITFGPDAHWDSVVVVLDPGERIKPPGPVPRRLTVEDLDGYDLGDPKRIALERELDRGGWA